MDTKLVLGVEQAAGSVHDFQVYKNSIGSAVSSPSADQGGQWLSRDYGVSFQQRSSIQEKQESNVVGGREKIEPPPIT